jgi:hypothetical protein
MTRLIALGTVLAMVAIGAVVTNGRAATSAAPVRSAEPQVSGPAVVGSVLSASTGTWSNTPTTFAYQWVRCPASGGASDGSDCATATGATASTYTVAAADVGFRLRVRVTATNADGNATAASNPTDTVPASTGIANTAVPTVTGNATVGSTLTGTKGTFTGDNLTYTYTWLRCAADGTCVTIAGANAGTYTVQAADVGATIRLVVVAASGTSRLAAASTATAAVTAGSTPPAPPTPVTGCPSGTGVIQIADLQPPARLSVTTFSVTPRPVPRSVTSIAVQVGITACGGRPVQGALVFATAVPYQQFKGIEGPTDANGTVTLTMQKLRRFPASPVQQLLAVFIRARQPNGDPLGGVSTRRLVSFRVNLHS